MSRPPLVDDPSRLRIRTEFDRSLLVEAGAGSGKTHELATRMAAGVARGAYAVECMAAVTFTRKAAAELRGRFQIALEAELASADGEAAARVRHALSNIERLFTGTIHAFCARLLRERPVEAGVSPGFVELDDAEEGLLREQSWRDYRAQAKAQGDPDYLALVDADVPLKKLDDAFETICLYEDVEFPAGDASPPDTAEAWYALERFWTELSKYLPQRISPGTTCKTQQRAVRCARDWRLLVGTQRAPGHLVLLLAHWDKRPDVVQSRWESVGNRTGRAVALHVRALHETFCETTVTPFLTAWRQYVYAKCVRVLTSARDAAAADRRRRNALSFNDLLMRTAHVLRTRADVRQALQRKYRWLFVDEFQDTDPLQAEIMFLLAGDEPAHAAPPTPRGAPGLETRGTADWRTLSVRPGALFVVGDPKQSIYRFRRADIDIYNDVRARLAGEDGRGVVTLTSNFRSTPALCHWANTVFAGLFPAAAAAVSPAFAPLAPVRDADDGPSLYTLTGSPGCDDAVAEEAGRIAQFIQAEEAAGRRTYGDFLVLTRRKKDLHRYAEACEAREVPVEVSGGSGFAESAHVPQLALLLVALSDPQDAAALVGVLRGPLFGLSDQDLFAFRQAGGWFSLATARNGAGAPAPPGEAARRVHEALVTLGRWHRWTRVLPAGAALERILEDSGYLALAAASPGGIDAGDLLHAVDRVRAVVETGFTIAEAAEALASWSKLEADGPKESTEIESLPLRPGRRDVVRIMNLHKAKGLEAPVVFLADPAGGFTPRPDVRIVRTADTGQRGSPGAAEGYFQIVAKSASGYSTSKVAEPANWLVMQEEEKAYLDAEDLRLLYVAATRAQDVLVVSKRTQTKGTPAWEPLEAHLKGVPELPHPPAVDVPAPAAIDLSAAAAGRAMREAESRHASVMAPSWSAASVTAELRRLPPAVASEPPHDAAVVEDGAADDPTRVLADDTPSRRADAGIAWGTLVHGLLEHAMRHRQASRDDLRRLAMWLTVETPELRPVIDEALDTVARVAEAPFWAEARAAAAVHEEVPFAVREVEAGHPKVLSGAIDLVYGRGDGWRIIDYKTDVEAGEPDLRAKYEAQIEAYRRVWARLTGAAVSADIVSARGGAPPRETAPPPARPGETSSPGQGRLFD